MGRMLWLLIETVGGLLTVACVLRAYAYRVHLSPHNPITHFVVALTDWLIRPLRRWVPTGREMDWPSLLAAWLVASATALAFFLILGGVSVPNPGAVLLLGVLWLIRWSLYAVIGLVIVQVVLSWVNPYAPLAPAVRQLTDPLLNPLRRVVPLIGHVDLSALVLIVLVQILLMLLDPVAWLGFLRAS